MRAANLMRDPGERGGKPPGPPDPRFLTTKLPQIDSAQQRTCQKGRLPLGWRTRCNCRAERLFCTLQRSVEICAICVQLPCGRTIRTQMPGIGTDRQGACLIIGPASALVTRQVAGTITSPALCHSFTRMRLPLLNVRINPD